MYTFESYIRNRTRPKASIAKGYLGNEFMTLCSGYLNSMKTILTVLIEIIKVKLRVMEAIYL